MLEVSLAGDFNGDGIVDAADYVVWRKGLGNRPADYGVWRANFGATAGSGSEVVPLAAASAAAAVPEPFSIVLLLVAAIAGAFFRVRAVASQFVPNCRCRSQCGGISARCSFLFTRFGEFKRQQPAIGLQPGGHFIRRPPRR
jgi:hypothetical protein